MRCRTAAVILVVSTISCGGSGQPDSSDEVVLRVSASDGLVSFQPTNWTGSTSYALDLAFDLFNEHAEVASSAGATVTIRRRASSPYDAQTLAASLRSPGRPSTRVDGDFIHLTFESAAAAATFLRDERSLGAFELGPFQLAYEQPGLVRLTPRGAGALDAIEIVSVPAGEQWRRLMAHEIDVIPITRGIYRSQFAGMSSVRLIDAPAVAAMALLLNTDHELLRNRSTRRRLAGIIDRAAIANVACGDTSGAASLWELASEGPTALPERLELVMLQDNDEFVEVGKVLALQLRAAGVRLEVTSVSVAELQRRVVDEQRFQLALVPIPRNPEQAMRRAALFASPSAYKSAIANKDHAAAREILRSEAFIIPLYELREFAAVDSRFCGGKVTDPRSWHWLADLYPCEVAR